MRKFIAIDGQHGAGKSYIVNRLYSKLISKGYSVVKTKEPTNSEIGLLARNAENHYDANILACLFAADRLQHCKQIKEWLEDDSIVISDRYIISGLILQNMDGVSFDYVRMLNDRILVPDLSVVVYADSNVIKERLNTKAITRLTKQEQSEGYDRYIKYKNELAGMFPNVFFCVNNKIDEGERIVKFVLEQIGVSDDTV